MKGFHRAALSISVYRVILWMTYDESLKCKGHWCDSLIVSEDIKAIWLTAFIFFDDDKTVTLMPLPFQWWYYDLEQSLLFSYCVSDTSCFDVNSLFSFEKSVEYQSTIYYIHCIIGLVIEMHSLCYLHCRWATDIYVCLFSETSHFLILLLSSPFQIPMVAVMLLCLSGSPIRVLHMAFMCDHLLW